MFNSRVFNDWELPLHALTCFKFVLVCILRNAVNYHLALQSRTTVLSRMFDTYSSNCLVIGWNVVTWSDSRPLIEQSHESWVSVIFPCTVHDHIWNIVRSFTMVIGPSYYILIRAHNTTIPLWCLVLQCHSTDDPLLLDERFPLPYRPDVLHKHNKVLTHGARQCGVSGVGSSLVVICSLELNYLPDSQDIWKSRQDSALLKSNIVIL